MSDTVVSADEKRESAVLVGQMVSKGPVSSVDGRVCVESIQFISVPIGRYVDVEMPDLDVGLGARSWDDSVVPHSNSVRSGSCALPNFWSVVVACERASRGEEPTAVLMLTVTG